VVCTDGVGPNLQQRARISAIEGASRVPTAIITASIQARGMATALSWLGLKIRAFKPEDLGAAFEFLDVPATLRSLLLEHVASFRAELAGTNLEELVESNPDPLAAREAARQIAIEERLERVRTRARARRNR
jgi:hypothetical protein